MKRFLPGIGVVLVVVLTVASGVIQGKMSNRWGPPPDLTAAGKRLENIPTQFGSWRSLSSEKMDDYVVEMLECTGYVVREYENQDTLAVVKVAVMVGPSGPMSVHTPEVCFSSRDYDSQGPREHVTVSQGSQQQFWVNEFQANNLDGGILRVYYGWNPGDRWSAPDDPRFAFADRPFIYKIQAAAPVPLYQGIEAKDAGQEFLRDFVAAIEPFLMRPSND